MCRLSLLFQLSRNCSILLRYNLRISYPPNSYKCRPALLNICRRSTLRQISHSNSLVFVIDLTGRGSVFGIATHYGLDGQGIESRWGEFSAPIQTGFRPHPVCRRKGTGAIQGVKRQGRGVNHALPSSADVKEKIKLYLDSPSVL